MCLNCGCMEPNDRHGDSANITLDDVQHAAEANGQSLQETWQNMDRTYEEAQGQGMVKESQGMVKESGATMG